MVLIMTKPVNTYSRRQTWVWLKWYNWVKDVDETDEEVWNNEADERDMVNLVPQ